MALSGRCYVIGQLYRGHYGAVRAENVSKVTRLLSAGARHEAQAGHHTRPQTTCPGDPDSRRLLGPWAGKRTQDRDAPVLTRVTPAGPRRRPASGADDGTAVPGGTALSSPPVPPAARLTPKANPGPPLSQASPSPATSGRNHPLLAQVVLDPPDTCTHRRARPASAVKPGAGSGSWGPLPGEGGPHRQAGRAKGRGLTGGTDTSRNRRVGPERTWSLDGGLSKSQSKRRELSPRQPATR